ncbi:MAG: spinster family MFS transporter [Thermoguttaceae bacterium]
MALLLLLSMNLLNYIDRYVLAAVEPEIRQDLLHAGRNDPHARTKTGLLSTAFLISYMLASPLFGWLGERRSRWRLIAVGVGLWSLASGASGLAATFVLLLLTRCLVGVGEAAYGPVAPTIIADFYPVAKRGQVLSWFYMAIPVGSALGYVLGGYMAAVHRDAQSWRWAFYAVVVPGLLLGLWSLWMREPHHGASEDLAPRPPGHARWKDYRSLLQTPSFVLNTLGMTAMTFATGAVAWWMPEYLESHHLRWICGKIEPVAFFGLLTAVAGVVGTLAGGIVGDACRTRWPGSYFLVSGVTMLACVPCVLLFLVTPFPAAWVFVFVAEFLLFFNTGPTNTILANVVHPAIRSTGFAVNILIIHMLGDAISPPLIGAVADRFDSLRVGFVAVSMFILLGGVFWLLGARHLEADTAAAPQRLSPSPGP